jgi:hypothetical protein
MRISYQFENSNRRASQLRSMIEDLKRGVLLIEADMAAVVQFERRANPTNSAYPIAARTLKSRRDNLLRTILALEQRASAAPGVETRLTDLEHHTPSEMAFSVSGSRSIGAATDEADRGVLFRSERLYNRTK